MINLYSKNHKSGLLYKKSDYCDWRLFFPTDWCFRFYFSFFASAGLKIKKAAPALCGIELKENVKSTFGKFRMVAKLEILDQEQTVFAKR